MSNTSILWFYPFVFRRVRRVDAKYAYLVVKDGYVPLRRREGVLRAFLPYVKYVNRRVVYESDDKLFKQYGYGWCDLLLETIDDVSSFFQTQMEEEHMLEEEYDVSAYGKLWDEMYGNNVDSVTFEETCDIADEREKLESLYHHY